MGKTYRNEKNCGYDYEEDYQCSNYKKEKTYRKQRKLKRDLKQVNLINNNE